jgi:hypothetical protein
VLFDGTLADNVYGNNALLLRALTQTNCQLAKAMNDALHLSAPTTSIVFCCVSCRGWPAEIDRLMLAIAASYSCSF